MTTQTSFLPLDNPNRIKEFQTWAFNAWQQFHEIAPTWVNKDYVQLAAAARRAGEAVQGAFTAYLRCESTFYAGKPPGKFLADLDRFILDAARLRDDRTQPEDLFPEGPVDPVRAELRAKGKGHRDKSRTVMEQARATEARRRSGAFQPSDVEPLTKQQASDVRGALRRNLNRS